VNRSGGKTRGFGRGEGSGKRNLSQTGETKGVCLPSSPEEGRGGTQGKSPLGDEVGEKKRLADKGSGPNFGEKTRGRADGCSGCTNTLKPMICFGSQNLIKQSD